MVTFDGIPCPPGMLYDESAGRGGMCSLQGEVQCGEGGDALLLHRDLVSKPSTDPSKKKNNTKTAKSAKTTKNSKPSKPSLNKPPTPTQSVSPTPWISEFPTPLWPEKCPTLSTEKPPTNNSTYAVTIGSKDIFAYEMNKTTGQYESVVLRSLDVKLMQDRFIKYMNRSDTLNTMNKTDALAIFSNFLNGGIGNYSGTAPLYSNRNLQAWPENCENDVETVAGSSLKFILQLMGIHVSKVDDMVKKVFEKAKNEFKAAVKDAIKEQLLDDLNNHDNVALAMKKMMLALKEGASLNFIMDEISSHVGFWEFLKTAAEQCANLALAFAGLEVATIVAKIVLNLAILKEVITAVSDFKKNCSNLLG